MKQAVVAAGVAILMALSPGSDLNAQWTPRPLGDDLGSFTIFVGSLQPQSEFWDGSSFESSSTYGAAIALWPFQYVGFRGNLLRSDSDAVHPTDPFNPLAVNDPEVWLFDTEVALRYPMGGGGFEWFPYVSGGIAAKAYNWKFKRTGDLARGWTFGGGVDLRPGMLGNIGLIADVRGWRSDFDYFGAGLHYGDHTSLDPDVRNQTFGERQDNTDVILTVGVSLNF